MLAAKNSRRSIPVHSPAAATNAGTRIGRNERFPQQYPAEDPSTDRIAARIGTGFEYPAAVLRWYSPRRIRWCWVHL